MMKLFYIGFKLIGKNQKKFLTCEECIIDKETPKTYVVGYNKDSSTSTIKKSDIGIILPGSFNDTYDIYVRKAFVTEDQIENIKTKMHENAIKHFNKIYDSVKETLNILDTYKVNDEKSNLQKKD